MGNRLTEIVEVIDEELFDDRVFEKEQNHILRRLIFPFAVADKENLNKRTYPSALLKREVAKMNKRIEDSKIAGTLEHPSDGLTKLGEVSHFIESLEFDDVQKVAFGTAAILNTTKGKDVLTLLQAGLKMGVSMRGFGTVTDGKVQDDYSLSSIDIVTSGSFGKDVEISDMNLHESLNSRLEREKTHSSSLYREALMAGYDKSFKEWKTHSLKED
ncbi:hypothetical protein ACFLT2_01365 [Acidobacteriota bacterium]